jgi:phospholipid transport system substrate-binding protein
MLRRYLSLTIGMLFLFLVSSVVASSIANTNADPADSTQIQKPHDLVERVTQELLKTISIHRETFAKSPEFFFGELDALLNNVIDFDWIAFRVMGQYAKVASVEQRNRFAVTFRRELIETYGRGLLSYGEQSIVVVPPTEDINGLKSIKVVQEIRGSDGVFPLVYSMNLTHHGSWKVTNLVINGINLGKIFRNQFIQRAGQFGGDIDKVIDNWSSSAN